MLIDTAAFFKELWKHALAYLPRDDRHPDVEYLPLDRVFTAMVKAHHAVIDFDASHDMHEATPRHGSKEIRKKGGNKVEKIDLTEKEKDVAETRYRVIKPYLTATNKSAKEATKRASEAGITLSTFYRWIKKFRKDGLEGLKPKNRDSGRPRGFSPEVESLMEDFIMKNLKKSNPISVSRCWEQFSEHFSNIGRDMGKVPSRCTFRARYDEYKYKNGTKKDS